MLSDDLLQCHILVLHEALRPPHGRGRRRRVGDIGSRDASSRGKSQGTAEERTSGKIDHYRLLPVSTNYDPIGAPAPRTPPSPSSKKTIMADGSCQGTNLRYGLAPGP